MTIPNPLSEKTAAEIEALSRKISVAQELDGEIQTELRGHIEDKVRGYVSGAVKVSEADAMLLAKAHFGDAAVIKGMFQGVHAPAHALSFARRLVAVFVLWVFVSALMRTLDMLRLIILIHPLEFGFNFYSPIASGAAEVFYATLWTAFIWGMLSSWRKRSIQGQRLWFDLLSWRTLFLLVLGSLLVNTLQPWIFNRVMSMLFSFQGIGEYYAAGAEMLYGDHLFILCVAFAANALLWIWWCDRSPRSLRDLILSAVGWVTTQAIIVLIDPISDVLFNVSGLVLTFRNPNREFFHIVQNAFSYVEKWIVVDVAVNIGLMALMLIAYRLVMNRRTAAIAV